MRIRRALRRTALCVLLTVAHPLAAGAGKFCGDPVESGVSSGTTQEEALAAAQSWWSSRAGALGRGYENWDNAADQAMECGKEVDGNYSCKASGRPCLPEGMLPENVPKIDM